LIREQDLCQWAADHPEQKISSLFAGKPLQHKLRRCEAGTQFPELSTWEHVKQGVGFLAEYFRDPENVGSVLPSSKKLAKEIVKQIPKDPKAPPRRILEIGPGPGPFSRKIIPRLNKGDEYHLVDINKKFCRDLRRQFRRLPSLTLREWENTTMSFQDFL
jgi:hypothetical protein